MGTNYYVRTGPCPNPCAHCRAPESIHLGKSSGGWTFSFRGYPEIDGLDGRSEIGPVVTDFASWLKLLDLGGVYDEYGRETSRDELLERIEAKRGSHTESYGSDHLDADGNRFTNVDFC